MIQGFQKLGPFSGVAVMRPNYKEMGICIGDPSLETSMWDC